MKDRDLERGNAFVCILFCGVNGMNGESLHNRAEVFLCVSRHSASPFN